MELSNAQGSLSGYSEKFKAKLVLLDAELAYWRYSLSGQSIDVQKSRLARASKLKEWSQGRVKTSLADEADLFQADAAVKVGQLELQAALDEQRAAARALNLQRGIDDSSVSETLPSLDPKQIETLAVPKDNSEREDVLASKEAERIAASSAQLNAEKHTPSLEVFGSMSLNGRDEEIRPAETESMKKEHPTTVVGLRFSTELDFAQVSSTKSAYLKDKVAAELSTKQKTFEGKKQWEDLNAKLDEAKQRLRLTLAIEAAQRQKIDHERIRLKRGRSTTAQVLTFEQDYSLSQLSRIKAQSEILSIVAQLKTFAETK